MDLEWLIKTLDEHDDKHGANCSCMDEHIRVVRKATECNTFGGQQRMDYILQKASQWRPLKRRLNGEWM